MQTDGVLVQTIDGLIAETYKPAEPGVAVIAAKDGRTIFRGARGRANLELGVAIETDMVFRIGSITKQFTAVRAEIRGRSTIPQIGVKVR